MFKCCMLVYRKPGTTRAEFARYWSENHSRLAAEAAPHMGYVRYTQNHVIDDPLAHAFSEARGCPLGDFDGMAEIWWPDRETMESRAGSVPEDVARAILADEARFVDLQRSILFFAEEKTFVGPADIRAQAAEPTMS